MQCLGSCIGEEGHKYVEKNQDYLTSFIDDDTTSSNKTSSNKKRPWLKRSKGKKTAAKQYNWV